MQFNDRQASLLTAGVMHVLGMIQFWSFRLRDRLRVQPNLFNLSNQRCGLVGGEAIRQDARRRVRMNHGIRAVQSKLAGENVAQLLRIVRAGEDYDTMFITHGASVS